MKTQTSAYKSIALPICTCRLLQSVKVVWWPRRISVYCSRIDLPVCRAAQVHMAHPLAIVVTYIHQHYFPTLVSTGTQSIVQTICLSIYLPVLSVCLCECFRLSIVLPIGSHRFSLHFHLTYKFGPCGYLIPPENVDHFYKAS